MWRLQTSKSGIRYEIVEIIGIGSRFPHMGKCYVREPETNAFEKLMILNGGFDSFTVARGWTYMVSTPTPKTFQDSR